MPRGNGKKAENAARSGKLLDYVRAANGEGDNDHQFTYVDWGEISPSLVVGAIIGVVRQGGALLLGCGRDNRTYSVKVYANGEGTAYYFRANPTGAAELEGFLVGLIEACED